MTSSSHPAGPVPPTLRTRFRQDGRRCLRRPCGRGSARPAAHLRRSRRKPKITTAATATANAPTLTFPLVPPPPCPPEALELPPPDGDVELPPPGAPSAATALSLPSVPYISFVPSAEDVTDSPCLCKGTSSRPSRLIFPLSQSYQIPPK